MKMVKVTLSSSCVPWPRAHNTLAGLKAGLEKYTVLSGYKDAVAWLQISQIVLVRSPSLSLWAEFVKGFLAKFLLDIVALLSYKASESSLVCTAYTPLKT